MLDLIIFIGLLMLGYVTGSALEKRHYKSILQREMALRKLPLIASKIIPGEFTPCETRMVLGSVVISVDFFKHFVAALRNILGGRVSSYESLIDRGRREALLRMREQARILGANFVFNIKMETSSISKGQRNAIGSIEVLAYGTALILEQEKLSVNETRDALNLRPRTI